MRLSTSSSCMKNGLARSAMAKFWRWQSGAAGAKEERREVLARKGREFEIEDYHVPISKASQTPSSDNYYSKTWETHKAPFAAPMSTNTSSGDQVAGFAQPLHQCAPCQPAGFPNHEDHPFPTFRSWLHASHSTQTLPQESFVITSFNILASEHAYTHRSLYPSVPTSFLAWSRRKRKVLHHLNFCSPDIICLQEVDQFNDLEGDLASRGYEGLYKARTGEMPDGCAIFWKKERFQLLQERSFEFSMLGMRNNVAQLCVLQLIVSGLANKKKCSSVFRSEEQTQSYRLVVGNIHVLFNPKRGEVKLGQCRAFLEQVHNMSSIWHGAPVVIGGDFNSTPSSAVYKYLATSELDLSNLDRRYLSGLVPEVPSVNANKSRKEAPSCRKLKETLIEPFTAELASLKKADDPVSCLLDKPVSSTPPIYASLVETQEQFEMQIGLQLAPSPERTSKERVGAVNQTNPLEFVGSNLEERNGKSMAMEQILGLREQTTDHRVLMAEGATEKVDASIQCTAISLEEAHGIDSTHVDKTHEMITNKASVARTSGLATSVSCVPQECSKLRPPNHVQSCHDGSIGSSTGHSEYDRDKRGWTWEELRMATGKPDCTLMQHELNLYSAYSEVQGNTNTRDAKGEPLFTTCHRDFLGTVDYIWRNEGLKTMRVLETVPVKALASNKGLPIMIWGSDHVPLACELAFS